MLQVWTSMCSRNDLQTCNTVIEEYYVVFTSSKHDHWLIQKQPDNFQHVYAVKKSIGGRFWIIINPVVSHTHVDILPVMEYPHIRLVVEDQHNDVILPVSAFIERKERHTLCIINCVEIVKSLLGIRAFWVWTPYQLYKYLIKRGQHERS